MTDRVSSSPPIRLGGDVRTVILLADSADDPRLAEQQQMFASAAADLTERDVVTHVVIGPHPIRRQLATPPDASGFRVVLIGKDGGVKLAESVPVSVERLCALIDSMPMRQREMRHRK